MGDIELEYQGIGSLLKKYACQLCSHVADVIQVATSLAMTSTKHFSHVSRVLRKDITGVLLPEMITCMILLHVKNPAVIYASMSVPVVEGLLDMLNMYNRMAPGLDRDDHEDLAWPGV